MNKLGSELAKSIREIAVLVKSGGEGSRGGKVIGHTRNGKPIYDSGHASYHEWHPRKHGRVRALDDVMAMKQQFPDFSHEDHADAAKAHEARRDSLKRRYQEIITDAEVKYGKPVKRHTSEVGGRNYPDDVNRYIYDVGVAVSHADKAAKRHKSASWNTRD